MLCYGKDSDEMSDKVKKPYIDPLFSSKLVPQKIFLNQNDFDDLMAWTDQVTCSVCKEVLDSKSTNDCCIMERILKG